MARTSPLSPPRICRTYPAPKKPPPNFQVLAKAVAVPTPDGLPLISLSLQIRGLDPAMFPLAEIQIFQPTTLSQALDLQHTILTFRSTVPNPQFVIAKLIFDSLPPLLLSIPIEYQGSQPTQD